MNCDVNDNNIISIKQLVNDSLNIDHFIYIKNKIDKNVKDCNFLYTQVCYLIKLFLLYDFEINHNYEYKFNELFIRFCFRLIQNNNKDNNLNLLDVIEFENESNIFKRLICFYNKFNSDDCNKKTFIFKCPDNLDSIIHTTNALSRTIQTTITNNIIINFYKYVKEYIKINLKLIFKDDYITTKVINLIFNDIIYNTYYSDVSFHNWIDQHKKLIIPIIKTNNLSIKSINDNIDNKQFLMFIKNYIKNDDILDGLFIVHNIPKVNKTINSIYNDIINNTFESNNVFHTWIKNNISLIINNFNKNNTDLDKELNKNPYIFIPNMLFINKNLELNKSKKKYQIIPLRTNLTPKFIPINTHSLVDIVDSKYLNNIKNYYHNNTENGLEVWNTFFNFNSDFIKKSLNKGYIFNNVIYTNGYEIIYNFIDNKYNVDKDKFHINGRLERRFIKDNTKNLTNDEKLIFINNNNKKKEDDKNKKALLYKEKVKKQKDLDKENNKKKVDKVKNELEILLNEYENTLLNLKNEYNNTLNTLKNTLNNEDKNYNLKLNDIIKEQNEKYKSDLAFINHCYKRNYETIITDIDNKIVESYNENILLNKQIDKNIIDIKNNILIKKNEIKALKKTIKPIKTKQQKTIINLRKEIIINNLTNNKITSILNKINKYKEQLKYESDDKSLTMQHVINLKLKLIKNIKKIYNENKCKNFITYIDAICNKNINEIDKLIKDNEIKLVKSLLTSISLSIILDIKDNKNKNNEIEKLINSLITNKENKNDKKYIIKHMNIKKELDDLSSKLNNVLKLKINNENKLKYLFKNKFNEYMKIDDMSKKQLEVVNKLNWVVIDPGMNSLFTMMSKDGNTKYNYTKQLHLNRTSRTKIEKKMISYKKNEITKIEVELSKEDNRCKTSNNYENFKKFFIKKMLMHNELEILYNNIYLNKLKWNLFINEKRSEKMLINDIKTKFGKDVVLILGDWGMNKSHIKGSVTTPNKKYTNILNKNLITLGINEFRTSIIHNKLEKECENYKKIYNNKKESIKSIYLLEKIKKDNIEKYNKIVKTKKVHKVLVCKTNAKSKDLFVNRDNNSVLNMKKIVLSYITTNTRPKTFVFGTKICKQSLRLL